MATKIKNVNVSVSVNDITVNSMLKSVETAQKQSSIWAEFSPEPAIVAVIGVALQRKAYATETDIALHLKLVFENDKDKVRITTIRAFYKKDTKTGEMLPKGVAFRNAFNIVKSTGIKIKKIHNASESPNLSTFDGWTDLQEPVVVCIETRETNNRYWPNNVTKYVPMKMDVEDIIADCGGDAQ